MPPRRRAAVQADNAMDSSNAKKRAADTRAEKTTATASKRRKAEEKQPEPPKKRVKVQKAVAAAPAAAPLNTPPTVKLQVFTFGANSAGEIGLGPDVEEATRPRLNPHLDPASVGVVGLAAGGMHAAAITYNHKIYTWGGNDEAALGRDTSEDTDLEMTPMSIPLNKFPAGTKFVQIGASDNATFVLTDTGLVYGWGTFRDSRGDSSFSVDSEGKVIEKAKEPMLIPGLSNIIRISIGENYALALDKKGQAYSWGNDEQHQLGHRVLSRGGHSTLLPSPIGLRDIISIHAGPNHAFAISKTGAVWAWGSNHAGQTGITRGAGDTGAIVFPPKQVRTLSKKQITMLDGGSDHSIGLTEDGKCLVWGSMTGYQTGLDLSKMAGEPGVLFDSRGNPDILLQPTALPIPKCSFVCAGAQHCLAITADGKAYSWGFNQDGQCGQGPEEAVEVATLIDSNAVRGKKFSWAAGGGQFSLLAGPSEGNTQPLTNGVPNGVH